MRLIALAVFANGIFDVVAGLFVLCSSMTTIHTRLFADNADEITSIHDDGVALLHMHAKKKQPFARFVTSLTQFQMMSQYATHTRR